MSSFSGFRRRLPGSVAAGRALAVAAFAAWCFAACGKEIGDECKTSVDCSIDGNRQCDISQPGGYCTVEGCDERSCPDDAVCVRLFPTKFADRPCDPARDPLLPCNEGELCCPSDQVCLPVSMSMATPAATGRCAPRSTERRYCAKGCGGDGDCRGGYQCRRFYESGTYPFSSGQARQRFCAPRP